MTLTEQVYARCVIFAGHVEPERETALRGFCGAAERLLRGRLREDLTAEDCGDDFVTAAALYALAMLRGLQGAEETAAFTVGDVSVTPGDSDAAPKSLMALADRILAPYAGDWFSFQGV